MREDTYRWRVLFHIVRARGTASIPPDCLIGGLDGRFGSAWTAWRAASPYYTNRIYCIATCVQRRSIGTARIQTHSVLEASFGQCVSEASLTQPGMVRRAG